MKASTLLLSALSILPVGAIAHPGTDASALHVHFGAPSASTAVDLRLTFAALVFGLAFQAYRAAKRR